MTDEQIVFPINGTPEEALAALRDFVETYAGPSDVMAVDCLEQAVKRLRALESNLLLEVSL